MHYQSVYVYRRYSSDGQTEGYSLERQRERALEFISKENITADKTFWISDEGLSGFHGEHIRTGEMGVFIKSVQTGEIRDGLLIVESVSRASRQGPFAVLRLVDILLTGGFTIKILDDGYYFNRANMPNFMGVMLALQAEVAHAESVAKSDFAKKNWAKRRKAAINSGTIFTSECPRWLNIIDGKYVPIPELVNSIKTIFDLSRDGYGISRLVNYANKNNLPAPGNPRKGIPPRWHLSLINRTLRNKALIGEFQPHQNIGRRGRKPLGEPIKNYYPAVIEPNLFYAVLGSRDEAAKFPRRRDDNNFNYLMGLAKCECGGSWRRMNKNSGAQAGYALYGCSNRIRSVCNGANLNARSFDFQFIQTACTEIPAMLVTGENPTLERRISLEKQLSDIQKKRSNLLTFIENEPDLASEFGENLRRLLLEHAELKAELTKLISDNAPAPGFEIGDAFGAFIPAYLDVYEHGTADAENAYRARALFRARIVESVSSVFIPRNRESYKVTLKNGLSYSAEIENMKFAPAQLTDAEHNELASERTAQLSVVQRISNKVIK